MDFSCQTFGTCENNPYLVTIGDNAFERSAITKIAIGSGVTSIGTRAFAEA